MRDKTDSVEKSVSDKAYFAAANTKDGFYSYFDDIFFNPSIKRRYIIKGGPGTGKSSFMKRVALWAQKKGYSKNGFHGELRQLRYTWTYSL